MGGNRGDLCARRATKLAKSDACAVYNILDVRVDARKEILELRIQDSDSKYTRMQIFDELKSQDV